MGKMAKEGKVFIASKIALLSSLDLKNFQYSFLISFKAMPALSAFFLPHFLGETEFKAQTDTKEIKQEVSDSSTFSLVCSVSVSRGQ